jgi:hypothetical protein
MNVIGLGKTGCSIVDKFSTYPQYKIYKVALEEQDHPEKYEQNTIHTPFNLDEDDKEIDFFISGDEMVCAASLKILENYKDCNIRIFYIKPNQKFLTDLQKMTDRVVYNVLQEYTRSKKFDSIYIINYEDVAKTVGKIPIIGYYDKLNSVIVDTIHMINFFDHNEAIIGNELESLPTYCINSIGIMNADTGVESMFFNLDECREKRYYYSINNKQLQTDGELFEKLSDQMENKSEEFVKNSFGVYSNSFDKNYCYIVKKSPHIQR